MGPDCYEYSKNRKNDLFSDKHYVAVVESFVN